VWDWRKRTFKPISVYLIYIMSTQVAKLKYSLDISDTFKDFWRKDHLQWALGWAVLGLGWEFS
jgi:hypothetical protein